MPRIVLIGAQVANVPRLPNGTTPVRRNQAVILSNTEWEALDPFFQGLFKFDADSLDDLVNASGSVAGDVLTVQADGSIAPETPTFLSKVRHARAEVTLAAGATVTVTLNWPTPFPDINYSVSPASEEATDGNTLRVRKIQERTAEGVVVRVTNEDALAQRTGLIHAIAFHD